MRHHLPQRAAAMVAVTAALWLPLAAPVHANTPAEAAEAALSGKAPRGQSLFRYWGFEVYVATLYTTPAFRPEGFEQQRLALELQYRRAFKGADIAQRSIDEMQDIAPLTPAQAAEWKAAMERVFPDVAPGDRLMGVHLPGRGAHFYYNGRLRGVVDDPVFAERFFGIWLSPRTSQPRLREALIAGAAR